MDLTQSKLCKIIFKESTWIKLATSICIWAVKSREISSKHSSKKIYKPLKSANQLNKKELKLSRDCVEINVLLIS
jgi:hypothetical protein